MVPQDLYIPPSCGPHVSRALSPPVWTVPVASHFQMVRGHQPGSPRQDLSFCCQPGPRAWAAGALGASAAASCPPCIPSLGMLVLSFSQSSPDGQITEGKCGALYGGVARCLFELESLVENQQERRVGDMRACTHTHARPRTHTCAAHYSSYPQGTSVTEKPHSHSHLPLPASHLPESEGLHCLVKSPGPEIRGLTLVVSTSPPHWPQGPDL